MIGQHCFISAFAVFLGRGVGLYIAHRRRRFEAVHVIGSRIIIIMSVIRRGGYCYVHPMYRARMLVGALLLMQQLP